MCRVAYIKEAFLTDRGPDQKTGRQKAVRGPGFEDVKPGTFLVCMKLVKAELEEQPGTFNIVKKLALIKEEVLRVMESAAG